MTDFNAEAVKQFLRRAVRGIEGSTWSEVAAKIGRLGLWEVEDYRP